MFEKKSSNSNNLIMKEKTKVEYQMKNLEQKINQSELLKNLKQTLNGMNNILLIIKLSF